MNIKILAIDNSTVSCSVALKIGDETNELKCHEAKKANEFILQMIQSLLSEASLKLQNLDAIAFGCGPGSFTGIRISAGVTQGLCFGSNIPAIKIPTLQAIAQQSHRLNAIKKVIVIQNAHMQEIYFGVYKINSENIMTPVISDGICKPDQLALKLKDKALNLNDDWTFTGDGVEIYHDALKQLFANNNIIVNIGKTLTNSGTAYDVANLAFYAYKKGETISAEQCIPVYLKENFP